MQYNTHVFENCQYWFVKQSSRCKTGQLYYDIPVWVGGKGVCEPGEPLKSKSLLTSLLLRKRVRNLGCWLNLKIKISLIQTFRYNLFYFFVRGAYHSWTFQDLFVNREKAQLYSCSPYTRFALILLQQCLVYSLASIYSTLHSDIHKWINCYAA